MTGDREVSVEEYYSNPGDYVEKANREQNKDVFSEFLKIREEFAEHLCEDDILLDAGCGPGVDAEFFNPRVETYIGIDISREAIQFAEEKKPGKFETMDMRDIEFEDNHFDAIWNSASLFFMIEEDMEKALAEFSRVLKEDGKAFLSWKEGEGSQLKGDEEKIREHYLTQEKAEELAQKHFNIVKSFRNEGRNQDFISFIVSQR